MGSAARYDRVVISVVCESEEVRLLKKKLEKSGIIYSEEKGKISFAVVPQHRTEDFQRAKKILQGAFYA